MRLFLNGESIRIEPTTLGRLLEAQGIATESSGVAVALNDEVVPRARWSEQLLADGDRLEVITATAGG